MRRIAIIMTLSATLIPLAAQPGMPKGPGGQYGERMEMMMIWKLTDYLELNGEQAEELFPKIRDHRKKVEKLRKDEMEFWKPYKEKMANGEELTKEEMDKVLMYISTMEAKKSQTRIEFIKNTSPPLNPTQQVKLLTFEGMMRNETQKRIRDSYRPGQRGNKQKSKRRF